VQHLGPTPSARPSSPAGSATATSACSWLHPGPRTRGRHRAHRRLGRAAASQRPQPAGSLIYEFLTGHPERQPGELVFLADLTCELRALAYGTWAT
jgi:hypothetical protein